MTERDDRMEARIPLPPRVRKAVGFGVLAVGAWFVLRQAEPVTPREVEVRVALGEYRAAGAEGLTVAFQRDGDPVRVVSARFGASGPPREWRTTVSLPPGDYRAVVTVNQTGRVSALSTDVRVEPAAPVTLAAPAPAQD